MTKKGENRLGTGMADVSNLDQHGKPLGRDDRRRMFNLGNQLWHSDSSFRAIAGEILHPVRPHRLRRRGEHRVRRYARRL